MPKKSMIKEYFNHLKEYVKIYGEKTILLWQCGSFYEVYGLKDKDEIFLVVKLLNLPIY